MRKIYRSDHTNVWEIIIEGQRIAVFEEAKYAELFERNNDGTLKNEPKLEMPNSSSNGNTKCKLTFGDKLEFNFQIYTKESFSRYLGKEQILVHPQIIIRKVWPIIGE